MGLSVIARALVLKKARASNSSIRNLTVKPVQNRLFTQIKGLHKLSGKIASPEIRVAHQP